MRFGNRGTARKAAGLLAVVAALAIPASASAGDVTVTAAPTSLPAPGGNFQFTVNVAKTPDAPGFSDNSVQSLIDSVYGNLNGQGTCAVPAPLPYSCTFNGAFNGPAGATQTNTVSAFQLAVLSNPFPSPHNYGATGSATVSLTAGAVQNPSSKKKCKKGFVLKKVKTKSGVKKKCVKKKKK